MSLEFIPQQAWLRKLSNNQYIPLRHRSVAPAEQSEELGPLPAVGVDALLWQLHFFRLLQRDAEGLGPHEGGARLLGSGLVPGAIGLDLVLTGRGTAEGAHDDVLLVQQGGELLPVRAELHVRVPGCLHPRGGWWVNGDGDRKLQWSKNSLSVHVVVDGLEHLAQVCDEIGHRQGLLLPREASHSHHLTLGHVLGAQLHPDGHPLQLPMVELPAWNVKISEWES